MSIAMFISLSKWLILMGIKNDCCIFKLQNRLANSCNILTARNRGYDNGMKNELNLNKYVNGNFDKMDITKDNMKYIVLDTT